MKVIGIDPGLAATGIGIVDGAGVNVRDAAFGGIYTTRERPLPDRLARIHDRLLALLRRELPDLMVVEDIYSLARYPQSGINLGKVTGVILLAGQKCRLPVIEVPVREAKKVLTGNGAASKSQLEKAVRHRLALPDPIKPFHASDALALALIGLFRFPACTKRASRRTVAE